jgi:hypothetical protein
MFSKPAEEEADRSWLEGVAVALFGFLRENFFMIAFWLMALCIGYVIFNKLTVPLIHPYYSKYFLPIHLFASFFRNRPPL